MNTFKKIILLSFVSSAGFSAVMITPALPLLRHSFQLSDSCLQWIVSLFLFGYVIGQLIYAPLANSLGTIKALTIGFTLNLLGILICLVGAIHHDYTILLVGRLISALGSAAGLTCTFMIIRKTFDGIEAKQTLSLVIVSFSISVSLAILIGGFLTQHISWQSIFYALLFHGVLLLIGTRQFKVEETTQPFEIQSMISNYRQALSNRSLIYYSMLVGLASVVNYTYSITTPLFSYIQLDLNPAQFGLWNISTLISSLLSGGISLYCMRHFDLHSVIRIATALCCLPLVSLLVFFVIHSSYPLWYFISTALLYFSAGLIYPCGVYFATRSITNTSHASSAMSFINMLSATVSVIILGVLPFHILMDFILVLAGFIALTQAVGWISPRVSEDPS